VFELWFLFLYIVKPQDLKHGSIIVCDLNLMKGLLDIGDDFNGIISKLHNCMEEM